MKWLRTKNQSEISMLADVSAFLRSRIVLILMSLGDTFDQKWILFYFFFTSVLVTLKLIFWSRKIQKTYRFFMKPFVTPTHRENIHFQGNQIQKIHNLEILAVFFRCEPNAKWASRLVILDFTMQFHAFIVWNFRFHHNFAGGLRELENNFRFWKKKVSKRKKGRKWRKEEEKEPERRTTKEANPRTKKTECCRAEDTRQDWRCWQLVARVGVSKGSRNDNEGMNES